MSHYSGFKIAMAALALALLGFGSARAAADDEAFVQARANEALGILADDSLNLNAKSERFYSFIDEITDVRRVSRFVLGKYARGATKETLDKFTEVFRRYSSGIYETQLDKYSGETVTVTGSQDRKPGDSLVSTVISGGRLRDPLVVNWRILTRHGRRQLLDVEVLGIWLALQQRTELAAVIANHGGDIGAAIDVLKARIADQDTKRKNKAEKESGQKGAGAKAQAKAAAPDKNAAAVPKKTSSSEPSDGH